MMMSKSIKDMSVEEIIIEMEKSELHSEVKKLRDCIGIIIIILCFIGITLLAITLKLYLR